LQFPLWGELIHRVGIFEEQVGDKISKKVTNFSDKHPLIATAFKTSLHLLPSPFDSIAEAIYDSFNGSDEEKLEQVKTYLEKIQTQGEEHYNEMTSMLNRIDNNVIELKDIAAKQNTLLEIKDFIVSKDNTMNLKLDKIIKIVEELMNRTRTSQQTLLTLDPKPKTFYGEKKIFVGRLRDIEKIKEYFQASKDPISIISMGGMGKSALAFKAIHACEDMFDIVIPLYFAQLGTSVASFLLSIAKSLNIPIDDFDKLKPADQKQMLIDTLGGKVTYPLVLADNYETISLVLKSKTSKEKYDGAVQINSFLKRVPSNTAILLTSRLRKNLDREREIPLDALSIEEGAQLFIQSAGTYLQKQNVSVNMQREIEDLVKRVGGHPLSIEILAKSYEGSGLEEIKKMSNNLGIGVRNPEEEERLRTLEACFGYSLDNLDENLRDLLPKLTIFKSPFPTSAVSEIFDASKLDITKLYNRSLLIKINPNENLKIKEEQEDEDWHLYSFHPAVRNFLEDKTKRTYPNLEEEYGERFSDYYSKLLHGTYCDIDKVNRDLLITRFGTMWNGKDNDFDRAVGLTTNSMIRAQIPRDLGLILSRLGIFTESIRYHEKALEIQRNELGENHHEYARSLNNLAELYRVMGAYSKAKPLLLKALEIMKKVLGENHPDYADGLNNLAKLYRDMGDYSKAEPLYQKAWEIRKNVLGENHPDYATSLNNLAKLYRDMGDYSKAEPLLQKALEIRKNVLGENHPDYATSLNNLAEIYRNMGDYSKAEPLYQKAWEIRKNVLGENHPDYADGLNNLAALYVATHRYNDAFLLLQESAYIRDRIIDQIFSIASERQRMLFLMSIKNDFYLFMSVVFQQFSTSTQQVQAAFDLVMKRKSLGAEALSIQRDALLSGNSGKYPRLIPQLAEVSNTRMRIASMILSGPEKGESPDRYKQDLEALISKKEKMETALASNIPEVRLEQSLKSANYLRLSNTLSEGEVLVELVRFDEFNFAMLANDHSQWNPPRYVAFVLRSKEPDSIQMIDLGDARHIDRMIIDFRRSISGHAPDWKDKGYELYKSVFEPLLPAIRDSKRLFIAPDGDLSMLPFEVLPNDKAGREVLIDKYFISYLSTGRCLLRFETANSYLSFDALVVGDPDYDLTGTEARKIITAVSSEPNISHEKTIHFERLPGTRLEAEQIADFLGVKPMLDSSVLKGKIKTCRSPRIFHLATQSFFLPNQLVKAPTHPILQTTSDAMSRFAWKSLENPMLRSGLALAGINSWLGGHIAAPDAENGILSAEDISGMDLSNTELVVLSGADTGLGEIISGEGVFGLRRAFVIAGAQTLIMSLWKVSDQQTNELMVDLYHRLLSGKPRAEALREAQLAMKEKYSDPYYWGAFICQGNPSVLSKTFS
jgi:CHAT domain-containing protein/Tfp pilus assembly protein PilF